MRDLSGCPDGSAPCVGMRAAQRSALAAPPNGHSGSATAYKRKYVRNTAVGGVGYRRMLGRGMAGDGRSVRPTARQRHRGRRHEPGHDDTDRATGPTARDPAGPYGTRRPSVTPCPATGPTARDEPDGTRSGDGPDGTRRAIRDAIRQQALRHATIIFRPTMSDCPVMSGDVR